MILYTTVPEELIFQETLHTETKYEEIPVKHGHLVMQHIEADEWRIVQLVSSDAQMYLEAKYTPGTVVKRSQFNTY